MSVLMKPSDVEWIGDIPKNWKTERIKDLSSGIVGGGTPKSSIDEYWEDGNIIWMTPTDFQYFKDTKYIDSSQRKITEKGLSKCSAKLLPVNTVVMSSRASIGIPKLTAVELTTNQGFISFLPSFRLSNDFLYYCIDGYLGAYFQVIASGTTFMEISPKIAKQEQIPLPMIQEQKLIANFLDKSTSKIEDAIKTKQGQLKTLEELKKSIIHKAVTKGLDDSVAMKDSGVEWIGEIPEHWTAQMLKRTTSIKGRIGWQGLTSDEYRTEGQHLLVTGTDFKGRYINWSTCHFIDEERYDEDEKIQLIDKDVLVTKDGTIGKISMAKDMPYPTTLNSGVFVTRPIKNDYIQEYMYWILASDMLMEFIEYSKVGSTIAHLYQKTFERFVYPLAPIGEQQPIVDFLDKEVEKIDTLKANVQNQINKLKEYKKSLIYEYVTGKKQVKE